MTVKKSNVSDIQRKFQELKNQKNKKPETYKEFEEKYEEETKKKRGNGTMSSETREIEAKIEKKDEEMIKENENQSKEGSKEPERGNSEEEESEEDEMAAFGFPMSFGTRKGH